MRCAIYCRYSSEEQSQASIDDQLRECRKYILAQGWTEAPGHVYVDEAKSGTSSEGRAAFNRMIGEALSKSRPFDAILVWHSSRFARNRADAVSAKAALARAGVRVISVTQPFDTDTAEGKLVEGIFESLDEYWSRKIAADVRRAHDGIAGRGFRPGGRAPYGYELERFDDPSGARRGKDPQRRTRLVPHRPEARIVLRILREFAAGFGYRDIARRLTAEATTPPGGGAHGWDPSAVRTIVYNAEVYAGYGVYGKRKRTGRNPTRMVDMPREQWIMAPNAHPAIIDEKLLAAVVTRREQIAAKYAGAGGRAASPGYALSSLATCAECGASVTIVSGSAARRTASYYGCSYRTRRRSCDNAARVSMDDAEGGILDVLAEVVLQPQFVNAAAHLYRKRTQAAAPEAGQEVKRLERQRGHLRAQLGRYVEAIGEGRAPRTILDKIASLEAEIERLDREIEEARRQREPMSLPSEAKVRARLAQARKLLEGARRTPQRLRHVLAHEFASMRFHKDRSIVLQPSTKGLVGQLLGMDKRVCNSVGVPNGI